VFTISLIRAKLGLDMANRPARYANIIDDLVIKHLEVETMIHKAVAFPILTKVTSTIAAEPDQPAPDICTLDELR